MRRLALVLLLLSGCDNSVQTTSGAAYRSARPEFQPAGNKTASAIDVAVDKAANVEPLLRFPARIGLARVDNGQLVAVPPREADAWIEFAKRHAEYGEYVPISPLIAGMAASATGDVARGVADQIRLGAARQHVDAVLIYEVGTVNKDKGSALSLLDLTVVGAFLVPSRSVQGDATASGVLLDVRNAYPYGTVSATASQDGFVPNFGSETREREVGEDAKVAAVGKLTGEVETMMAKLRTQLQDRELASLRTPQGTAQPRRRAATR